MVRPHHRRFHSLLPSLTKSIGYPSSLQNASPAQGNSVLGARGLEGPSSHHHLQARTHSTSAGIARPTLPIDRNAQIAPDFQYSLAEIERIGNQLSEFEIEKLPPNLKTVSDDDWHVLYNPNPHVPRSLDIELVHTLNHSSVVCCVRFSHDGKFVATGCNRSAQIYDVASGQLVSQLQDDTVSQEGDLYIRSVCFSPDGKYLATGAEDKIIRVSLDERISAPSTLYSPILILGLGHLQQSRPSFIQRTRAGYLLSRLCPQWQDHRIWLRR